MLVAILWLLRNTVQILRLAASFEYSWLRTHLRGTVDFEASGGVRGSLSISYVVLLLGLYIKVYLLKRGSQIGFQQKKGSLACERQQQ